MSDVNSVFNWDVAEKRKAMCTEQRLYANAFTIEELGKEDQANFYMVSGTLPYILMMLSNVSTHEACHVTAINGVTILVPTHVAKSLKLIRRSAPVDEIYECPISKWVSVTWFIDKAPG